MDPLNFNFFIISTVLSACVPVLPLWLVWIVSGALAIKRWNEHPRVSLLLLIAVIISLFISLISPIANISIRYFNVPAQQLGMMFSVVGLINTCFASIAWALTFAAAFGWRKNDL